MQKWDVQLKWSLKREKCFLVRCHWNKYWPRHSISMVRLLCGHFDFIIFNGRTHLECISVQDCVCVFPNTFLNIANAQWTKSISKCPQFTDRWKQRYGFLGINISVASSGRAVFRSVSSNGLMTNSKETSCPFLSSRKQTDPERCGRTITGSLWTASGWLLI